ncbi:MAG: molybdate ABC transporter substrate-binding protein [Anaerolineales bacterium]
MNPQLLIRTTLGMLLALASCAPAPRPITLTVFAAASLKDAFTELGERFEMSNAGVTVSFNFAGSQQLAQQLVEGAPADVFASANQKQMDSAIDGGRIAKGATQPFVKNRLVVIVPADNPAQIVALADLARPGLKLILAAREVPVGQYSLDFLEKTQADSTFAVGFKDAVLNNVVSYEENVRAVLSKVSLGEADAGIVYTSDVSGDGAEQIGRIEISDDLNTIAIYPIAPVGDSAHAETARAFVDFVLSSEGQATLKRYGFISITP